MAKEQQGSPSFFEKLFFGLTFRKDFFYPRAMTSRFDNLFVSAQGLLSVLLLVVVVVLRG